MIAERRFGETISQFLDYMTDLARDLQNEGLSNVGPEAVTLASFLISSVDQGTIIRAFAHTHHDWHLISKRDPTFITDKLRDKFNKNGIAFDISLLHAPFLIYKSVKESEKWSDVEEEDLPISQEDIDMIWAYMRSLVGITCRYISLVRSDRVENGEEKLGNPSFMSEINIPLYEDLFGFSLSSK